MPQSPDLRLYQNSNNLKSQYTTTSTTWLAVGPVPSSREYDCASNAFMSPKLGATTGILIFIIAQLCQRIPLCPNLLHYNVCIRPKNRRACGVVYHECEWS